MTDRTMAVIRIIAGAIITIAGIYGFSLPFGEETIYSALVAAVFLITQVVLWWKNNNVTDAASLAQSLLDRLKAGDAEVIEAVDRLIEGINAEEVEDE